MGDELRADIQAAVSKMSSKVGSRREIKKLPEYLWEGERVDMITSGTYGAGTGIVVLTDRRLFFLKDGVMSKTSEDFPLGKISSVQWSSGMLLGKIIVFASGNKAEILNVQKADGKAITDAVRARLSQDSPPEAAPEHPPTSPASDAQPDVYEQLAKLGDLRNAGVLTDEEFEKKKAELLSRI
ncbi:PH domain-containing protein [Kribbella sp. CA-294648]|uniref:PH domain-containing protein n=1 Tax=Kribbella sp. CA-294648 TaxID=3239948 RepID=UPI003D9390EF